MAGKRLISAVGSIVLLPRGVLAAAPAAVWQQPIPSTMGMVRMDLEAMKANTAQLDTSGIDFELSGASLFCRGGPLPPLHHDVEYHTVC